MPCGTNTVLTPMNKSISLYKTFKLRSTVCIGITVIILRIVTVMTNSVAGIVLNKHDGLLAFVTI